MEKYLGFEEWICEERTKKGLSKKQLAIELMVDQTLPGKWEAAKNVPDEFNRKVIAEFFGVSVEEVNHRIRVSEERKRASTAWYRNIKFTFVGKIMVVVILSIMCTGLRSFVVLSMSRYSFVWFVIAFTCAYGMKKLCEVITPHVSKTKFFGLIERFVDSWVVSWD